MKCKICEIVNCLGNCELLRGIYQAEFTIIIKRACKRLKEVHLTAVDVYMSNIYIILYYIRGGLDATVVCHSGIPHLIYREICSSVNTVLIIKGYLRSETRICQSKSEDIEW